METLSAPVLSLAQLVGETVSNEPILLISTQGTDPSIELRTLVATAMGDDKKFREVILIHF